MNLDKIDGKDANKNGTDGKMGFNEPVDPKADKTLNAGPIVLDKSKMSINEKRLYMKFKTEDDFFIVGRAGWGKTSLIHQLANKFGYEVIPFYLDKCEAVDLGGTPIPVKDKEGDPQIKVSLPTFAEKLKANPNKKFLLFFDEMNQAAPDVMNALMPIVLEHEIAGQKFGKKDSNGNVIESNFFVGAAGNFESENGAVNELSGPLKSRFKPIIVWETDTPETWRSTFNYIHSTWDDKIGKELVDEIDKNHESFENPREIEHKLIKKYIYKMIVDKDNFDVDEWLDHLQRLAKDNLSRSQEDNLTKLAEKIFKFVKNGGKDEEKNDDKQKGNRDRKDREGIPENVKMLIKHGMQEGWVKQPNDPKKYGISRENIYNIEDTILNGEQMERLISKFEADGIKFKYEKDEEWKMAGYSDPNED